MTLSLSTSDRAALAGELGPGTRLAMSILSRMAPLYGASKLLDISAAHIDSSVYMGQATLEFAERLASLGAKVSVPSSLNVSGVDEHGWSEWAVPAEWAEGARRQMRAYEAMGCNPTWTCAPYQTAFRPVFGQQIASGESNAIAFFNSVIGARTARYPDLLDICAAITGRAPAAGLHLDEHRAGTKVLHLSGVSKALQEDETFYPVLGHLVGQRCPDGVPVITGLDAQPPEDHLKALGAGAATSGAVALFHIVGVTPEAPTLADALRNGPIPTTVLVTAADLRRARDELSTAEDDRLDMILLGSPHFSIPEFNRLADLVSGRRKNDNVALLVTCSRAVRDIVQGSSKWPALRDFGVQLTVDTCPLTTPMLPPHIQHIMTNSAKYAYYAPGLLKTSVAYGRLEDCIDSAVLGRVQRDEAIWADA